MYWFLTLRCVKINRGSQGNFEREIWCHSITDKFPIEYLKELEKYKDESYYLVNAIQITKEDAEKYDGVLTTM